MATSARVEGKWAADDAGSWEWQPASRHDRPIFTPEESNRWGVQALTNPDHPPTEDRGEMPETALLPHGGYWSASSNGGGAWTWNNAERASVGALGNASYEERTDPKQDPSGHPNAQYNQPTFPDGTPNSYYVAPDVDAPDLTVEDGWPKDITGDVGPQPGGGQPAPSDGPPPSHAPYRIDPSSIRSAEEKILDAATTSTNDYTDLRNYVAATNPWIFATSDPRDLQDQHGYSKQSGVTNQMSSLSDNLLLDVADTIRYAGVYVNALNNAAQMYARADLDSFVPET